ncbi:MAG TPA: hypothetical protein VFV73_38575 [Streptosporangiaceae bacterium]|nr:hypothetical protein [Streptosporangiaceae bacterium]
MLALIRRGPAGGRVGLISQLIQPKEITMYAQLTYFDGPRSPEQQAAEEFASQERLLPAVSQLGQAFRVYRLRHDDGSMVVISIADSQQALLDAQKAIMSTELLPGEDPSLLPGPDRIELYPVLEVHDIAAASENGSER